MSEIIKTDTIILYGSNGYTGSLIAEECKSRKLRVILAGRNREALQKQSDNTGFPFEVVELKDSRSLVNLLRKGKLVLNCAGPFRYTAEIMLRACLEAGTHYTDVTGEYEVFEKLAEFDVQGKKANIMVMPGVGFDVVPSDCLALHLKKRLPGATHLQLAFTMSKGGLSRGTAKTAVEALGSGSTFRRDGKLVTLPIGERLLEVDFGKFKRAVMNVSWGDISTAWRSTGIPNIEVYMGATDKMIRYAKISRYVNWLLRAKWIKNLLIKIVNNRPPGPTYEQRALGKSFLWGKAWNNSGKIRISTLETANGYMLTAKASVLVGEKILAGKYKAGFQTPAMAYGADLILELGALRNDF